MKVYQLSKKLLTRLAKELDAEIYRRCYRKHWSPADGDYGKCEYVHVYQMDYLCSHKYCEVKLVLKSGKTLGFSLGQQLKILDEYVSPDTFVEAFVKYASPDFWADHDFKLLPRFFEV